MKAALILATGVVMLAVAGVANSGHGCNGDVIDIGGALYIDVRGPDSQWVYQESNGTPGLQSGGFGPLNGIGGIVHADDCNHANPDKLLY